MNNFLTGSPSPIENNQSQAHAPRPSPVSSSHTQSQDFPCPKSTYGQIPDKQGRPYALTPTRFPHTVCPSCFSGPCLSLESRIKACAFPCSFLSPSTGASPCGPTWHGRPVTFFFFNVQLATYSTSLVFDVVINDSLLMSSFFQGHWPLHIFAQSFI